MEQKQKEQLSRTIQACIDNGYRILDDAMMLEFAEPPTTACALAIIAEEEFAKGFLLSLVEKGIIPWNRFIWRATRDHTCKQLLAEVINHLNPDTEEWLERISSYMKGNYEHVNPAHIVDSLNILRHEKIGRWESDNWFWAEEQIYDPKAKKIADGYIDKQKQNAIYIGVGKNGEITSKPTGTYEMSQNYMERAKRIGQLVKQVFENQANSIEWADVKGMLEALFSDLHKN